MKVSKMVAAVQGLFLGQKHVAKMIDKLAPLAPIIKKYQMQKHPLTGCVVMKGWLTLT